jgi:deoxyadenosine/deoxycytidine kinase
MSEVGKKKVLTIDSEKFDFLNNEKIQKDIIVLVQESLDKVI